MRSRIGLFSSHSWGKISEYDYGRFHGFDILIRNTDYNFLNFVLDRVLHVHSSQIQEDYLLGDLRFGCMGGFYLASSGDGSCSLSRDVGLVFHHVDLFAFYYFGSGKVPISPMLKIFSSLIRIRNL